MTKGKEWKHMSRFEIEMASLNDECVKPELHVSKRNDFSLKIDF